jgi:subtilisin family serine protease
MMARKSTRTDAAAAGGGEAQTGLTPGVLISFAPDAAKATVSALADGIGLKNVAYAADIGGPNDMQQLEGAGVTVFNALGVAVLDVDPDQEMQLSALSLGDSAISSIEKEPIFFAFADGLPPDFGAYLRGYRDAVDHLYDSAFTGTNAATGPTLGLAGVVDDDLQTTWGLKATKVADSHLSGKGVRVAVLDTGFDFDHPDFRNRVVTGETFIPGQAVQDLNGHGTHCIGTACGPRAPTRDRRYGIAYDAEIYAGKVLSNQGSALGRSTLFGIEWAVGNGCHIVSMSLGGLVLPGQRHLQAFEDAARRALDRNTLIIAAAGNDSRRSQGLRVPVSSPANCPSVLAVAAVDRSLRVADFSNAAVNPDASVDIAAPGVEVYSSAPEPAAPPQPPRFRQWGAQYDTISGTSMATPHVAGIAALLKEANPAMSAGDLWRLLTSRASPMPFPASDVGAGLVQV